MTFRRLRVIIIKYEEINIKIKYRKIPVISPGLIQVRKGFGVGL